MKGTIRRRLPIIIGLREGNKLCVFLVSFQVRLFVRWIDLTSPGQGCSRKLKRCDQFVCRGFQRTHLSIEVRGFNTDGGAGFDGEFAVVV